MKYRHLALLMFSLALAACSGPQSEATADSAPSKKAQKVKQESEGSTIKISGNEDFSFEQQLRFGCKDDMIHIQTMTQAPKFNLYLPAGISAGEYSLADFDANSSQSYVDGKAVVAISGERVKGSGSAYGKFYSKKSTGTVKVTKKPVAAGETFAAEISASLASKDGETIQVAGKLEMKADGFMMMNCKL